MYHFLIFSLKKLSFHFFLGKNYTYFNIRLFACLPASNPYNLKINKKKVLVLWPYSFLPLKSCCLKKSSDFLYHFF